MVGEFTTHLRTYSGDWEVHWGITGALTHGQVSSGESDSRAIRSQLPRLLGKEKSEKSVRDAKEKEPRPARPERPAEKAIPESEAGAKSSLRVFRLLVGP